MQRARPRASQAGGVCAPKRDVAILFCPERRKASAHPLEGNPFFQEATVFENSTACAPRPAYGRVCVQVRRRRRAAPSGADRATVPRLTRLVSRSSTCVLGAPRWPFRRPGVETRASSTSGEAQVPLVWRCGTARSSVSRRAAFLTTLCEQFFTESLILAQDERWRRA